MGIKEKSGVRGPKSDGNRFGLRTIVLAVFVFAASMARGDTGRIPTVESIGSGVQCSCGCVAPLSQCPMLDCAEKAEMRAFIKKEIADGKDEDAIRTDLAARYGVKVLTSPPAKGFNLAVWILPGVGLMMGLGIAVVLVRRWKHKPDPSPVASKLAHDPKVLEAMEEEMKATGMK